MKLDLYVNGKRFLRVDVADGSTYELRKADQKTALTTSYKQHVDKAREPKASKKRKLSAAATAGQTLNDLQDRIVRFTYATATESLQTYNKRTSDLKAILSRILTKPYDDGAELRVRLDDDSILEWDPKQELFFDFDWSKAIVVDYDHGLETRYRITLP